MYWRTYKIQKTLFIGQWHLSPLPSRHLGTSHSSSGVSATVQNTLEKSFVGIIISCPVVWGMSGKSPTIVNIRRMVCMTKDSGLEWAPVDNDNFTVLVSGGSRHHWVSMCAVWPPHSKWLNDWSHRATNLRQILHDAWASLRGNYLDGSEGCSYGQLILVTSPSLNVILSTLGGSSDVLGRKEAWCGLHLKIP